MLNQVRVSLVAVSLLLASLTAGVSTATAATRGDHQVVVDKDGVRFQVVPYADLNLDSRDGNEALYRRLQQAAVRVCTQPSYTVQGLRTNAKRCARTALAQSVLALGNRHLTALHQSSTMSATNRG